MLLQDSWLKAIDEFPTLARISYNSVLNASNLDYDQFHKIHEINKEIGRRGTAMEVPQILYSNSI